MTLLSLHLDLFRTTGVIEKDTGRPVLVDFGLARDGARGLAVSIGASVTVPAGGIVLRPPLAAPLVAVEVNGRAVDAFDAESATIREVPARVVLRS